MYKLILLFSLTLLQVNSYSQEMEKGTVKDSLIWYSYIGGRPNIYYINATKTVAAKWGIKMKVIFGGCTVREDELTIDQEESNEELFSFLADKYGPDWRDKFQKQVKQELTNTYK